MDESEKAKESIVIPDESVALEPSVSSIVNSLEYVLKHGLKNEGFPLLEDGGSKMWIYLNEFFENAEDIAKPISTIRKIMSLPSKLFMRKVALYIKGIAEIPEEKRDSYIKKLSSKEVNRNSIFVLNVINKIEEESKIPLLVSLFRAELFGLINDEQYRRLTIMVDRTLYSDLDYLRAHLTHDELHIKNDAEQGLLSNGWLKYAGQEFSSIEKADDSDDELYIYTNLAKCFCQICSENQEDPNSQLN